MTRSHASSSRRLRSHASSSAAARSRSRSPSAAARSRSLVLSPRGVATAQEPESSTRSPGAVNLSTGCSERRDETGAMVSSHEPAMQVSGGTRPATERRDQQLVSALTASWLLESDDDGLPLSKRRRLRRTTDEESKVSSDESDGEDECVVARILGRRGTGTTLQYLVQWLDQSSDWMDSSKLHNCSEMVATYDRYLKEHPARDVPYVQFISSDLPPIRLMAESPKDDCALHALQMSFELMGGLETTVRELEDLSAAFLSRMKISEQKRFGGLKYTQLVKFMREEVPKTGWAIDMGVFSKNWFKGNGVGPGAVAKLAWRVKDPLGPGAYLVYALKSNLRGHCVAMMVKGNKMVIREDGVTSGIMTHTRIRNTNFVRRIALRLPPA